MKQTAPAHAPHLSVTPANASLPASALDVGNNATHTADEKTVVHIAVMVHAPAAFGRAICRGTTHFAQLHNNWELFPFDTNASIAKMHKWLQANQIDGVVSSVGTPTQFHQFRDLNIPFVNVLQRDCAPGITSVTTDSVAIGRMAADFFLRTGFHHFAFTGVPASNASRLREKGFRETLAALGHTLHTPPEYDYSHPPPFDIKTSMEPDHRLEDWLHGLPKPVALLAFNDVRGLQVVRTAHKCGINVPGQLAVLGVDNDELICELCIPTLSSIDTDCEGIGYAAARALNNLLRGATQPGIEICLPPLRIIERQSTNLVLVENAVVAQALRIIRDHGRQNLTTQKLCAELNCTRSKLDTLFKLHLGCTPSEEITRGRMQGLTDLLQGTDLPLKIIAEMFKFPSVHGMFQFIRRETGITPMELRHKNRRG